MKLYHVVAMAKNRVIGKDNKLPWHLPADLKYFKELTSGQTVIMGRKTYESIFAMLGKPLPNRQNLVLTRQPKPSDFENLSYFTSIDDAIASIDSDKAFIIGGAHIYEQTIDRVDGIYLTQLDQEYEGDAFYPPIPAKFREQSRQLLQEDPLAEALFFSEYSK